ncbi:unnamed protein product [Pieris brassicae]|uniref:Uncharacterized protein n=2 Tax=Pieris brassicae TaxID=7116 RepID=A0A9P0TD26_PIEBR|nr:unnamed protein product [Pieris brassicae]
MKFSTNINKNTYLAYKNNTNLECNRILKAEDFEWDLKHPKSLVLLCIESLNKNWSGYPNLEQLVQKDREYFLEILNTNLPLQILVDNIKNDIFWKRCYYSKWSDYVEAIGDKPWINIFMERYCADILETMNPREYDPEKVQALIKLCGPYTESLSIRSLIPADIISQRITSPEMADLITTQKQNENKLYKTNEELSRDHISLHAALSNLHNLVELHITYQLRSIGVEYRRDQFQFTNNDAKNLAKGLQNCNLLKVLRITRTDMNCQRVKYILRGLLSNSIQLDTLDFSHCKIGNEGASYIAKFMSKHDKLRNLILADNVFDPSGIEVISQVLNNARCGIRTLDLRLNNKLGSDGIAHIAVSLARGCNLTSLNISGCGISPIPIQKPPAGVWSAMNAANPPTCGDLLARAIGLVKTPLRSFDISVNNIGSPSDMTLSNAICLSYLIDINLKRSGMSPVAMSIAESASAAQRLRREAEKGIRFRRSAGRVVQARRVVKGMNIDADPVLLAQQLSARPSIVSVASEDGFYYNVQTEPLPREFGFVPAIKGSLSHSHTSSITGPPTSRRSSHHVLFEADEKLINKFERRKSDGSILPQQTPLIKIFISRVKDI